MIHDAPWFQLEPIERMKKGLHVIRTNEHYYEDRRRAPTMEDAKDFILHRVALVDTFRYESLNMVNQFVHYKYGTFVSLRRVE